MTKRISDRLQDALMTLLTLGILAFILTACAKPGESSIATTTNPAPIESLLTKWCGVTIESVDGLAFTVDATVLPPIIQLIKDGIYGYPGGTNAWGVTSPPCWFQILNGVPSASTTGPGGA